MKKIFKTLTPFLFFGLLYFFWFDYNVYLFRKNPQLFQKDLPTASALAFFAITGALLLFLAYRSFKFFKSKFKKPQTNL